MTEALQQEIRTLQNVFESERDPEGRVFAPLADAYRRAGEIPQAVRLLNEGIARHPDFVPGHVVAAELYVEQGLTEEAAIAARNALQLDPENVNALRSLLRVLDETRDPEADEVRNRLAALEPGSPADAEAATTTVAEPISPPVQPVEEEAPTTEAAIPGAAAVEPPPALQETAAIAAVPPDLDMSIGLEETEQEAPAEEAFDSPDPAPESEAVGEEPLVDLDTLSPTGPVGTGEGVPEPVEATEAPYEPGMDVVTEEPVVDLDDLAPVAVDEAVDEAAPAAAAPESSELPDELAADPEEPVMELADLGPEAAAEEPVMGLSELAPGAESEEDATVMDMTSLAPDAPAEAAEEEEEVVALEDLAPVAEDEPVALADLAPDAGADAPVALADLAPDAAEDEPVGVSALAPDATVEAEEPVTDLSDLAPDAPEPAAEAAAEEPVMELSELAPGAEPEEDETVMDMTSLAPDAPAEAAEEEGEVVALEDLAPAAEDESVALADLAPDAAEDEPVGVSALAPDATAESEEDAMVMDMTSLAPDAPAEAVEAEEVVALEDLAPAEEAEEVEEVEEIAEAEKVEEAEEPVTELADPAPDAGAEEEPDSDVTMVDLVDRTPDLDEEEEPDAVTAPAASADADATTEAAGEADGDDHAPGEPVYTRTLAELYVKQGAVGQALQVYRHLSTLSPEDDSLQRRIEELESGLVLEDEGPGVLTEETEEEVEKLARELAENGEGAGEDVESPFTMDDEPGEPDTAVESGPTIGDYLQGLLGWTSEKRS